MRRWAPGWSEALKARAARYALERSLGPFLEERLRLEQLSLDLRGGTGALRDLRLRAAAVDEVLAGAGAPLELREGCLAAVTITVPWAELGSRPCHLHVTGLRLALSPRQWGGLGPSPPAPGQQEPGRDPPLEPPPLEGLEALALTIDAVLRRLRVVLEDTVLRVELPPTGTQPGAALELRLPRVEYQDEGGLDAGPPAVLHKGLRLCDLRLFCQELPPRWPLENAPPRSAGGVQPWPLRALPEAETERGAARTHGGRGGEGGGPAPTAAPPAAGGPAGAAGGPQPPWARPGAAPPPPTAPPHLEGSPPRGSYDCLWGGALRRPRPPRLGPRPAHPPPQAVGGGGAGGAGAGGAGGGPWGSSPSPAWSCWRSCWGRSRTACRFCGSPRRRPGPPPPSPACACATVHPAPPPSGEPPVQAPPPARELSLELSPFESDLDLGLMERVGPALACLGGPAPGHALQQDTPPGKDPQWAWPSIRWAAPEAVLRLRLPQVDLRPPPRPGTPPPACALRASAWSWGGPAGGRGRGGGALVCTHLLVVYEAKDMGIVPCLRVEPGPGPAGTRCLPMLEVMVPDPPSGGPPGPPPTPFSARRSIYESHELVLPGTPEELEAFVGGALGGAPCTLRLTLPRAHLCLRPPELAQRLYNRINNDLLLWEPTSPAPSEDPTPTGGHTPSKDHTPASHAPDTGSAPPSSDTFKPCKSAFGTDSEEEEEEDEGPTVTPGDSGDTGDTPPPPQSGVALLVTVLRGRVTADCHPPTEGVLGGRLVLEVGEGRLCVLPRPGGQRGGTHACAEVRHLALYHGSVPEEAGEGLEVPEEGGPPPPAAPHFAALGGTRAPP
ncbi:autophagy-related protein 2 homolog A isoform X2 [Accipiter gentilis]|uniref:autophagy-related protein 2 homolog A isoform X2 n=1 Tax=Astur gentilis TaxID=8957 RepID=UPI00210F655E|nr:autophagy-related protein 2 homolog A isoform X2 [Accipiter gentilis]